MIVTPIKTALVTASSISLLELLDQSLAEFAEGSVLVVTSKIVSLCEGSVAPADSNPETLIAAHADYWLPRSLSKYGHHFTISQRTLVGAAGIDKSNSGGSYVLWPKDAQAIANQVRAYLLQRFGVRQAGVIISDSTSHPMRRGASGIALAYSGFMGLNSYIGQPDLFGATMHISASDVAGGLAASAVFAMGEGREQTPLCVINDATLLKFVDHDPTTDELNDYFMTIEDDLFAPFWQAVPWQPGHDKH